MTTLVLDTGALIALDRNDRRMWARLRVATDEGAAIHVPAGTIAQAWRDGRRQALLARALQHCTEWPLDGLSARAAGLLCATTDTSDVIDASVVITAVAASKGDRTIVFTSDPRDIANLADAAGAQLDIRHT